jgi:hypothetical protein
MKRLLGAVAGFLMVGTVLAQANTTPGTAVFVQWGQKVLSHIDGSIPTQYWFKIHVNAPRSYCVETGQPENAAFGDKDADTFLSIYSDALLPVANNDEALENEPAARKLSRACFIPTTAGVDYFVKLEPGTVATPSQNVQVRFVETTLFCPWFFVAGDYNAFSLIRNNSDTTLSGVVVTWFGLNGSTAGTTTVSIPADGGVVLNARDFVNPATFPNGTVVINHAGSPQQLSGSTTTLSATTGLGFDAQFTQRQPW